MSNSRTSPRLVSLGEVLWDLFPEGPKFGGAPANLAAHAAAHGCDVAMVSRVGADELGRRAVAFLNEHGAGTRHVQTDPSAPTGTVRVTVDEAGKPEYEIVSNVAWDRLEWLAELNDLVFAADAVCFGTLAQRQKQSAETIQKAVRHAHPDAWRFLDLNLRAPFIDPQVIDRSLQLASALKLNDEELERLTTMLGLPRSFPSALEELGQRYELRLIAVTRGAAGSYCRLDNQESTVGPVTAGAIVDTVGAGDSFAATLLSGLLRGASLSEAHQRAAAVAAYVCTHSGAVPQLPPGLRTW